MNVSRVLKAIDNVMIHYSDTRWFIFLLRDRILVNLFCLKSRQWIPTMVSTTIIKRELPSIFVPIQLSIISKLELRSTGVGTYGYRFQ